MFGKNIEIFITKRVIILLIILSIANIIFMNERWKVLAGLLIGTAFSVIKFYSNAYYLRSILTGVARFSAMRGIIIRYLISQISVVIVLTMTIVHDIWFFAGITAGLLSVPVVIFINSITEGLGFTHNNFK